MGIWLQKRQKGVAVAVCSENHDRSEKRTDRGGKKTPKAKEEERRLNVN